jgi:hypothetical protein
MRTNDERLKVTDCLHCGKKLSLLQLLANGRFCSDAHEQFYDTNTEAMMLNRLRMFD